MTKEKLVKRFKKQEWFPLWKKNIKKSGKNLKEFFNFYTEQSWVDQAFYWRGTEEGHTFWLKANHQWNALLLFPESKLNLEKIGGEWESSPDETFIEEFPRKFYENYSLENDIIYELNIKPIDFINVSKFLETYFTICHHGGWQMVEGEEDVNAGSLHLHISTNSLINWQWVYVFPHLFTKNTYYFRDAISYRAKFNDNLTIDSKRTAVTINTAVPTFEFRLNENPLPLWVYLIPFFHFNKEKWWGAYQSIGRKFKNFSNSLQEEREDLWNHLKTDMKRSVLRYWRKRMEQDEYALFKKIIIEFINNGGNSYKIYKKYYNDFGVKP